MKYTHLVPRKWGHSIHFDFRHKIPTDLVSYFGGKRQFQISLNNVSTRETLLVSQSLKILVQELFSDIRSGMKDLTICPKGHDYDAVIGSRTNKTHFAGGR